MAKTKNKKKVIEVEPEMEPEIVQASESQAETESDAHVEPVIDLKIKGFVPLGQIQWIKHPDYPGLEIGCRLNVAYGQLNGEVREDGYGGALRKLAAMAPVFRGWDFTNPLTGEAIPEPDRHDLETYKSLLTNGGLCNDLGLWIHDTGYWQAVKDALGNS